MAKNDIIRDGKTLWVFEILLPPIFISLFFLGKIYFIPDYSNPK